jgi:hypothetical protein
VLPPIGWDEIRELERLPATDGVSTARRLLTPISAALPSYPLAVRA